MTFRQHQLRVRTDGRGAHDITETIDAQVRRAGVDQGLAHVFLHHTSASLILCENADVQVRRDLEAFLARLVPDGDPLFRHTAEGPDDMPAHVRTILTQTQVSIPIRRAVLDLGRWQGLYLYEHRASGQERRFTLTVMGEDDVHRGRR